MPIYLCCSQRHCYEKIDQSRVVDADIGRLWYCDRHKTEEDRQCKFTDCKLPADYTDPELDGKWYCQHHRGYVLRGMKSSETEKLKEALDAAEFAFNSIVSLSCSCSFEYGLTEEGEHEHAPLCTVLIAQNALDEIKAKLGDS